MSKASNEFQDIIDQLIPILQAADFDDLFKAITAELTKPQQFQIKITLNELKKPCTRHIDLRGHVNGECGPYDYDNKTHFMDDVAIKTFERELIHYGSFTMGVYEQVINTENNYRVQHKIEQEQRLKQKEEAPKANINTQAVVVEEVVASPYSARKVQFQSYAIRSEERMNYSIAVEMKFAQSESFKGTTSDLSVSGCKVRLPKDIAITPGQLVIVHFRGLEEEFALGLSNGLEYEIVATEETNKGQELTQNNFQYVRMKRSYSENTQAFNEFLNNFINGNKRRYKVNMENTEEAVIIKGYEQYYIPRITTLPLFVADNAGQYSINAILTTENNKYVLRYWRDHQQHIVLHQVFNQKRIAMLLANQDQQNNNPETLLYSFTHTRKGHTFFYAALQQELESDEQLKHLFFGFGAQKVSWRVHKVQLMQTSYDHAHIPLSLPDSASEEVKSANRPPSARVQRVLQHVSQIIALSDITELKKAKQYQSYEFNLKDANELKPFGVPIVKTPLETEVVAIDYVNLRKESRFLYQTDITIEQPPLKALNGITLDFSTKGMQLEVTEPCEFIKNDVVLLSLPQMQKITRNFKLSQLPYEVVTVSKNKKIINIRIHEESENHIGRKFFQQLIQSNRSKLTEAEEAQTIPGLPLAMRNMYVSISPNMPFYIHRKGIKYMLDVIGRGGQDSSLHKLMAKFSTHGGDYHTFALTHDTMIDTLFATTLKSMKRQDAPISCELMLSVKRGHKEAEEAITIELNQDLRTDHSHQNFITEALDNDLFFCYRIMISRTGRPDIDYIAKELKYVGNYAIHRAKVLEEELWGVIGVADAIDISDELMMRYGFSETEMQIQQQAKQFFFAELSEINI